MQKPFLVGGCKNQNASSFHARRITFQVHFLFSWHIPGTRVRGGKLYERVAESAYKMTQPPPPPPPPLPPTQGLSLGTSGLKGSDTLLVKATISSADFLVDMQLSTAHTYMPLRPAGPAQAPLRSVSCTKSSEAARACAQQAGVAPLAGYIMLRRTTGRRRTPSRRQ